MLLRRLLVCLSAITAFHVVAPAATAQPLGTFRWQLLPFCNVIVVTVVQQGGQYQLDGTDDQCGAAQQASVTGLAFLNPNGSIGFGLNVVTAPGGQPVHVSATIALATLSGTWFDSAGASGSFVYTPGAGTGGSPRPATGIGVGSIDPTQIQTRVTGTCPAGQLMTSVNQNGSVNCQGVAASGGDITGVLPGTGLSGGGLAGDVTLAVNFAGPGAASTAARSDHDHSLSGSTRIGVNALLANTTGSLNVAVGGNALRSNTTGSSNIAIGNDTLFSNTSGASNAAVGVAALENNTTGGLNIAVGPFALNQNTTGSDNTALGESALLFNTTGPSNVAVGRRALRANTTAGNNVAVGFESLLANTTGDWNTAVGTFALQNNLTAPGNVGIGAGALRYANSGYNAAVGYLAAWNTVSGLYNAAIGTQALFSSVSGSSNVAVGINALYSALGSNNIAIGGGAGDDLVAGDNNLYIGADGGLATESNATYIRGISGATSASGVGVFVNAAGKLGTLTSSIRFKEDVQPMTDVTAQVQALRPVTFYYKPEFDDGSRVKQYGLIAEEVAEVMPGLVARDKDGAIQTVRYQFLTPLLLAEVQRLELERVELTKQLNEQASAIAELRTLLDEMRARMR